ncbi:hypothetical protein BU16DRAFT_524572 [Lophium mytilinum]|uniref:Heterokaryon incompatibility domain-containing protein n=1 Tax=Lophium mytilinum TaxID=390894 RepID=A0A6A6R3G9_9PEZI|nr:hypothetical protein BU16DRAFT_524572 [Lophium mytilinum]
MAPIDFFKAFVNCITDRSWWWRVWTVQEFYLPQRVQFQIGLRRIPLEEFDLVFQVLTSAYKSTFGRTDEQYLAETRWINGFDRITQMLNLRRGRQIDIFGNNGLYEVLCRTYCPFRFQESDTYLLKATCRIDQIYGLVALYDDFDVLGLTIDYRKTWQEVYSDVAQSLILTDNMDVLAFCQRENASQSSTLPSWVPIWHEQFDTPHAWWKAPRKPDLSALGNSLFSAASNFTVEVSFETTVNTSGQSTRSMQIEGVFVDEVSEIKSQYFRAASIHYTEKKEFVYVLYGMLLGEIQALCDLSRSLKNAKYTPTSLQDAAWRIPVWDHEIQEDASWTRAGEATRLRYQQCMPVYETVQKHMDQVKLSADSSKVLQFPLLQLGAQINEILRQYMSPIILGRPSKPFMTRNGYLGMGPASMEPTDSVCLLFGARVPCVLRKRPGEEGGYVFVGEAFVYGIMDGEFLREDQLSTTFEIF